MKYILFVVTLSMLLSACQPASQTTAEGDQTPAASSKDALTTSDLMDALASAGATVGEEDEIEQPFFSVPGHVISVNGESVQVFEYADISQADAEAAQVSPNGSSIGTTMATWIGPPHFYRAERLIVLYVGEDQSVMDLLETILGPQFAGAEPQQ